MKLSEFINESLLGIDMKGGKSIWPATDHLNGGNGIALGEGLKHNKIDKVYKKYEDLAKQLGFGIYQSWPEWKEGTDPDEYESFDYVLFCPMEEGSDAYWMGMDESTGVWPITDFM